MRSRVVALVVSGLALGCGRADSEPLADPAESPTPVGDADLPAPEPPVASAEQPIVSKAQVIDEPIAKPAGPSEPWSRPTLTPTLVRDGRVDLRVQSSRQAAVIIDA